MSALPQGTRVGKYALQDQLGVGGFGITYLARDDTLDIKLAIKEYMPQDCAYRASDGMQVLPRTGGEEQFAEGMRRFLTEARILARLDGSPGIVGVRDYFEQNGTAYLVMHYIEGVTLRKYLAERGGKLPWAEAVALLLPAMAALAEVHEAGVLHRDISPDNIMVTPDGKVRLLDFGAARQVTGATMSVILKPGYAPEEQYRAKGKHGPWTDVYAMAATLWRCVTGRVPPESLDRLAGDVLQPPSAMGVAIPPAAEAALMQAMEVRAENRTPDIPALVAGIAPGVMLGLAPGLAPRRDAAYTAELPTAALNVSAEPHTRTDPAADMPVQEVVLTPRKTNVKTPLRAVLTLALVFVLVIGLVGIGTVLIRSIKNPFGGLIPTASPTPSPTPTVAMTATPSMAPSATPDATPDATPTPEPTLTPSPTPDPGVIAARPVGDYMPQTGRQWHTRLPDGRYIATAAMIVDGRLIELAAAADEFGIIIGTPAFFTYEEREGALWRIDMGNPQNNGMVLPANPQLGQGFTGIEGDAEIIAVNRSVGGANDVILVHIGPPGNDDIIAYTPGRGLFTRYAADTIEGVGESTRVMLDIAEGAITDAARVLIQQATTLQVEDH